MHFVCRECIGEIAHALDGVGRIPAVRKSRRKLPERGKRLLGHFRIALGQVRLHNVAEQTLVFAKVHQSLEVIRVVDIDMIRVRADESIAGC